MNEEQLETWRKSVLEHSEMMKFLVNDSLTIKQLMVEHLKNFFDFDSIKFEDGFNKIIIKWDYGNEPIIDPTELNGLGMEFLVSHSYSDMHGDGILIELYPFGLVKEESV